MAKQITGSKISKKEIEEYRGQLLDWYDSHAREIPWRVKSGEQANPYYVWLSEIMCQQTTVQAVKPYYLKFIKLWPTVQDLANANPEDVMAEWAGLGYYARARNLHKCAKVVANDLGGKFPETEGQLKKLPGIGDYTSAAIAAIAFGKEAVVVDGNVERVMARFFAVEAPLPDSKQKLKKHAAKFFKGFTDRPGDLAQAFMDLGAGICIPKIPRCILCPMQNACVANRRQIAHDLPYKTQKKDRPQKYGNIYWIKNEKGEVLFEKRPDIGLLGGMNGLPTTSWHQNKENIPTIIANTKELGTQVHHTFTHFDLTLELHTGTWKSNKIDNLEEHYFWASPEDFKASLPTVFKKAYVLYIKQHEKLLKTP